MVKCQDCAVKSKQRHSHIPKKSSKVVEKVYIDKVYIDKVYIDKVYIDKVYIDKVYIDKVYIIYLYLIYGISNNVPMASMLNF